jgi:Trp operon repressor
MMFKHQHLEIKNLIKIQKLYKQITFHDLLFQMIMTEKERAEGQY